MLVTYIRLCLYFLQIAASLACQCYSCLHRITTPTRFLTTENYADVPCVDEMSLHTTEACKTMCFSVVTIGYDARHILPDLRLLKSSHITMERGCSGDMGMKIQERTNCQWKNQNFRYITKCRLYCSGHKCNSHNMYVDFIKFRTLRYFPVCISCEITMNSYGQVLNKDCVKNDGLNIHSGCTGKCYSIKYVQPIGNIVLKKGCLRTYNGFTIKEDQGIIKNHVGTWSYYTCRAELYNTCNSRNIEKMPEFKQVYVNHHGENGGLYEVSKMKSAVNKLFCLSCKSIRNYKEQPSKCELGEADTMVNVVPCNTTCVTYSIQQRQNIHWVRGCEYSAMLNYFNEESETLEALPKRYNAKIDCIACEKNYKELLNYNHDVNKIKQKHASNIQDCMHICSNLGRKKCRAFSYNHENEMCSYIDIILRGRETVSKRTWYEHSTDNSSCLEYCFRSCLPKKNLCNNALYKELQIHWEKLIIHKSTTIYASNKKNTASIISNRNIPRKPMLKFMKKSLTSLSKNPNKNEEKKKTLSASIGELREERSVIGKRPSVMSSSISLYMEDTKRDDPNFEKNIKMANLYRNQRREFNNYLIKNKLITRSNRDMITHNLRRVSVSEYELQLERVKKLDQPITKRRGSMDLQTWDIRNVYAEDNQIEKLNFKDNLAQELSSNELKQNTFSMFVDKISKWDLLNPMSAHMSLQKLRKATKLNKLGIDLFFGNPELIYAGRRSVGSHKKDKEAKQKEILELDFITMRENLKKDRLILPKMEEIIPESIKEEDEEENDGRPKTPIEEKSRPQTPIEEEIRPHGPIEEESLQIPIEEENGLIPPIEYDSRTPKLSLSDLSPGLNTLSLRESSVNSLSIKSDTSRRENSLIPSHYSKSGGSISSLDKSKLKEELKTCWSCKNKKRMGYALGLLVATSSLAITLFSVIPAKPNDIMDIISVHNDEIPYDWDINANYSDFIITPTKNIEHQNITTPITMTTKKAFEYDQQILKYRNGSIMYDGFESPLEDDLAYIYLMKYGSLIILLWTMIEYFIWYNGYSRDSWIVLNTLTKQDNDNLENLEKDLEKEMIRKPKIIVKNNVWDIFGQDLKKG